MVVIPCRTSPAPYLAHEIIMAICEAASEHARPSWSRSGWRQQGGEDLEWIAEVGNLLNCCLVSRSWYAGASRVLYSGKIILYRSESLQLLLRTVLERNLPDLVQYLYLQTGANSAESAELVAHCPGIRQLQGHFSFSRLSTQLPTFQSLQVLSVSVQAFAELAPLLHHLPNLKTLDSFGLQVPGRPKVRLASAPRERGTIPPFPPPTYELENLYVSQCNDLSYEHWNWLLASSTSLNHVEVQDINDGADALAEVIGPHVRSLHLKGMLNNPQMGEEHSVRALPAFSNLKALWVSGEHWLWDELYGNIKSSLESFTISYSKKSTSKLTTMLNDSQWQPTLQSVTVHHWADSDVFYGVRQSDVEITKAELEVACAPRPISFSWITHGQYYDERQSDAVCP